MQLRLYVCRYNYTQFVIMHAYWGLKPLLTPATTSNVIWGVDVCPSSSILC